MKDKISIVMPCYRAEQYVADIVGDVLQQTYADWELLAVSNGPGQEPQLALLRDLASRDPLGRIKVFSVARGNVSYARNEGLSHVTGDWLTFVDADDRLLPDHLQRYADAVAAEGEEAPDLLCGGITECWVKEGREGTRPLRPLRGREAKTALLLEEPIMVNSIWNKLFRTAFVRHSGVRFKEEFTQSQDAIFVRELLLQTEQMALFPLSGYKYMHHRVRTNSMSRYHACFCHAVEEKQRLLDELLRQVGLSEAEISAHRSATLYVRTYQCFFNLFRANCPLSFAERRREVQRIVFAAPDTLAALKRQDPSAHNRAQRIFDAFCRLGSPWCMTAFYHCAAALCYRFWPLFQKIYPLLHKKDKREERNTQPLCPTPPRQ